MRQDDPHASGIPSAGIDPTTTKHSFLMKIAALLLQSFAFSNDNIGSNVVGCAASLVGHRSPGCVGGCQATQVELGLTETRAISNWVVRALFSACARYRVCVLRHDCVRSSRNMTCR